MSLVAWKVLGVICLLAAGAYVAVALGHYEHRRLGVLDAYITLLYHVKGQIDCYALPIRDIFLRTDPALLSACLGEENGLSPERLEALLGAPESSFLRLVRDSRLYLDPEAERILSSFASELGYTNRADQVTRCDYCITSLDELRRRLSETLPARVRLVATLSVCVAVGAAILLW